MGPDATNTRTMPAATGIAGLAGLVLVAGSQALVQVGGAEPAFDAPADEILSFFEARNRTLYAVGSFLGVLAALALLWFFAGLSAVLRAAEGQPAWRSTIALASGIVVVVPVMSPGWDLAGFRVDDRVDEQLARLAFDQGNLGFANAWLGLASFLAAVAWIILANRWLPSWLGWWALLTAVGFLAGRAFWTTPVWLIPYALFWVWVVVVSVQLLRGRWRPAPSQAQFDHLGRGTD